MTGATILRCLARCFIPFPSAIVLAYHRVANIESDPQLLCVSNENFSEHMKLLRRRFNPLSLQRLNQGISSNGWKHRTVVVTFDDGYADNLLYAKPCLEDADVSATVFVTAGKVGSNQEFWWDELETLFLSSLSLPPELRLKIDGKCFSWRIEEVLNFDSTHNNWHVLTGAKPSQRHIAYLDLVNIIRVLQPTSREEVMNELFYWAGKERVGRLTHRILTQSELCELANSGIVEIGAHTVNHPVLSTLPEGLQQHEITESKRILESYINVPVNSFAYPFGGRNDYTKVTVKYVKTAGFTAACSNFEGHVSLFTNPYQVPRYLVRNWDADEFEHILEHWFAN